MCSEFCERTLQQCSFYQEKLTYKIQNKSSISAWFFIRAQAPNFGDQYRRHTTILDYGGKPNISYNGLDNSLKMRKGSLPHG